MSDILVWCYPRDETTAVYIKGWWIFPTQSSGWDWCRPAFILGRCNFLFTNFSFTRVACCAWYATFNLKESTILSIWKQYYGHHLLPILQHLVLFEGLLLWDCWQWFCFFHFSNGLQRFGSSACGSLSNIPATGK